MRPIKCRGKRIIDGKWIYGVPYLDGGWHIMIDSNTATPEEGTGSWRVDPATVGQFTGLTDKNGKANCSSYELFLELYDNEE